jgi:hypothetical protein
MFLPQQHVYDELGALLDVDVHTYIHSSSWEAFISKSRHTCDIAPDVKHLKHPAFTLLQKYKMRGAPIIMNILLWPIANIDKTIKYSPRKSALQELMFLQLEFVSMM